METASEAGMPETDLILGLDEAGRGSVVGPLVVGGFVTTSSTSRGLFARGVRDSKLLTPRARERIYQDLQRLGRCLSVSLAPARIDPFVGRGLLNDLEARAFAELVRRSKVRRVVADACDPSAARFARTIERYAQRPVSVDARHHADRDHPVVAAASIVAKVRRDRAVARIARRLGEDVGSGYPSDAVTVAWVERTLRAGGPPSPYVRYSWRTTERLKASVKARTLDSFG